MLTFFPTTKLTTQVDASAQIPGAVTIHTLWRRGTTCLMVISLPLLLNACVSMTEPRTPDINLPDAYDTSAHVSSAEVLDHWWSLYDDAQLTMLTEQALANGFSVREAIARLNDAVAQRSVALAAFAPQGNLQGNVEYRETRNLNSNSNSAVFTSPSGFGTEAGRGASRGYSEPTKSASLSFPVTWEVDFFGRRSTTNQSAQADIASAQFDVEAARAEIAAEVARSLFQARGLMVQRNQARTTVKIQDKLMWVLNEQAKRGLAPASDADRVAGDLAQARARAEDADAAVQASRRALLAILGKAGASLTQIEIEPQLGNVPTIPATLPSDLLKRRPDVRKAAADLRGASSNLRLAELDFFPTFSLNPSIGWSAQRGSFDVTTGFWSLAAGLMVPILDRSRLHAQLDIEGARAEQAVLNYEKTVQAAFSDTDQAMLRLQADRRRVATLTTGEASAHKAYDAMLERYQRGFADLQDLLGAEQSWRTTRTALTNAELDALQRSVELFQALGGGWNAIPASISDNQGEVE